MPNNISLQNSFIGGLKTEYTGLNFPENSCTSVSNCVFSIVGDVLRRGGIDYETNFASSIINRANTAVTTYKWNNVGGDGLTQIVVLQAGGTLYFFKSSAATTTNPLSNQMLASTILLSNFVATGSSLSPNAVECQYSDGNGYLFVYNPACQPFYCTYNAATSTITGNGININIRDFNGVLEPTVPVNFRPTTLTNEHQYNLVNQGWTSGAAWTGVATSANYILSVGSSITLNISTQVNTTSVTNGSQIQVTGYAIDSPEGDGTWQGYTTWYGVVTAYSATTPGTITITIQSLTGGPAEFPGGWTVIGSISQSLSLISVGYISSWFSGLGNYPSNADVWWQFKNASGVFSPSTTISNVTLGTSPSPMGHVILDAFNQRRTTVSAVTGITDINTSARPRTGAFYAGRVWYSGVDAAVPATGDAVYTTWTENIYFSQVVTTGDQGGPATNFGQCYQTNDPTDETLFAILPTDGGVINIQGCGSIYKLFPVTNGLLVFAANGIWFITGNQGLGFTATDYSINKISNVRPISGSSFVNVLGWPMFWNEEGIYTCVPGKEAIPYGHGGINVENICIGTIQSFYNSIPLQSKKFAKGDYDPISFVLTWVYRSTNESTITSRYEYDSALNVNIINRAIYPYTFGQSSNNLINGIIYVEGPGGSTSPTPSLKYLVTQGTNFTFATEQDTTNWCDFFTFDGAGVDYTSSFTAGYQTRGKAATRWQPQYVYMYLRNQYNVPSEYQIQAVWDWASSPSSGRISTAEQAVINNPNFAMVYRRHRLRGRGLSFQIQVSSVSGTPFDIMGWSVYEEINQGT
jgi:hypothetical protein